MPACLHLAFFLASGLALAAAPGRAQTTTPADNSAPCSVAPEPQPCGTKPATPAKQPNAAEKFPFPGETSDTAASTPDTPTLTPAPTPKKSAQDAFPFPGETPATPTTGSTGSSSSSDDSTNPAATPDPAQPALTDKGSEGTQQPPGRHLLHRVNPIGTKLQTDDEREAEDLDIAHYYTQTGDLQGAYLRSQDAVKLSPDDPDAHFTLAEIALKLNKRDQAIAEYNACLKLDPLPNQASAAHKALTRLNTPAR